MQCVQIYDRIISVTEDKKSEENYIDEEIKKLSEEAEILFPNWEFFGFLEGSGCSRDIGYEGKFTSERLLYEGQIFDIVCKMLKYSYDLN